MTTDPNEPVDLLGALQRSVERARATRNDPCPTCGGDRLRPDHTGSGRCHAGKPPADAVVIPTSSLPPDSDPDRPRFVREPSATLRIDIPDVAASGWVPETDWRRALAEIDRLRGLIAEALDGWADECASNAPGMLPPDGIAEIRRAAGLA